MRTTLHADNVSVIRIVLTPEDDSELRFIEAFTEECKSPMVTKRVIDPSGLGVDSLVIEIK